MQTHSNMLVSRSKGVTSVPYPSCLAQEMPLQWQHARLNELTEFLKEEQKLGNFKPQPGLPF